MCKVKYAGIHVRTRVKEFREKANLTQNELADRVGIVRQTLCKIENHQCNPRIVICMRLARALNVEMKWLFIEEGSQ